MVHKHTLYIRYITAWAWAVSTEPRLNNYGYTSANCNQAHWTELCAVCYDVRWASSRLKMNNINAGKLQQWINITAFCCCSVSAMITIISDVENHKTMQKYLHHTTLWLYGTFNFKNTETKSYKNVQYKSQSNLRLTIQLLHRANAIRVHPGQVAS